MAPPTWRRLALLTAALSAVPLLIPTGAGAVPAPPATAHIIYGGNAYGSTVRLGLPPAQITSGKTSLVSLCTGNSGDTNTNNTAASIIPGVGTIGAVLTTTSSTLDGTNPETLASAQTGATNLLAGAIQIQAITANSHEELVGGNYVGGGSVSLVNAVINGQAISNNPTRDQTISIPGLASIVLNHQHAITSGRTHAWNTTAVTITVLPGNPLGVAAGIIVLSSATAALHEPSFRRPFGDAYGTTVNLANGVAVSGRTAFVALPCGGSDGVTLTNTIASVSVPGVLTTGTDTSTATSTDAATLTTATTTSQIQNVSLAGGLIQATTVNATANAARNGAGITFPGSGATFVGLSIGGIPQGASPPRNTVIPVPGLGSVTLNYYKQGVTSVQVYAIVIVLTVSLGVLNPGSKIVVAATHAGVFFR